MVVNFPLWLQVVPLWLAIVGTGLASIGMTLWILSIRRQIVAQRHRREFAKRPRLRRLHEASGA